MKLPRSFYARPTLEVAPELLGKFLVHRAGREISAARILEVEAYLGPEDRASHARFGPSKRSAIMFGPPGVAYVYLIYGMHHCVNVVCERDGTAGAVLIRALDEEGMHGPGRLCRALGITRAHNGLSLVGDALWIEDRGEPARPIETSRRVGVDYAGVWAAKKFRFTFSRRESKPSPRRRRGS